jgi:hypothetical protein
LPPGTPATAKFDKNLGLSQASEQGDKMKISSGMSQSQRGDEKFVIVQYVVRFEKDYRTTVEIPVRAQLCVLPQYFVCSSESLLNMVDFTS